MLSPLSRSVKGYDKLATTTSPLPSSLDPTPAVSLDERFSGPDWDQLATPWAHVEGPDRLRTSVFKPLQDRVSPHLELFLAQLAVPVRCAMRSYSSLQPFWSRSVWWLAFCVMHLSCCTVNNSFLPYLPVILVPLPLYRATTLYFPRPFAVPLQ